MAKIVILEIVLMLSSVFIFRSLWVWLDRWPWLHSELGLAISLVGGIMIAGWALVSIQRCMKQD